MADPTSTILREYLIPPPGSFWQWQERGEVACWVDGQTIVFRAELAQVLARLAPQGLPPLGGILLLLAATRDNWGQIPREAGVLAACLKKSNEAWKNLETLYRVIDGLEHIHQLEPELRVSAAAKSVLAEVVFAGVAERTSPQEAEMIAEYAAAGLSDLVGPATSRPPPDGKRLLRDLAHLRSGLRRVKADALRLRLQTGLDELPSAADLEIPPAERVRTLLAELKSDTELGGLARLALDLMAAVTVPRTVSDREQLPLGGVSDIANRGPLDRLLLSELAYDDLTLAVRVAVNEALFLRRESPPRTPSRQRAMLLDAGIRTWGVPRVFATAVALALAATSEPDTEIAAYRAQGSNVEPVELTTRAGIVAHLGALEADLHPARAWPPFQHKLDAVDTLSEPILITTDDVLEDAEFQRLLSEQLAITLHVATVNREGRLRLLERTARGSKLAKEVRLDLTQLFREPDRVLPTLVDRSWAGDLPAILSCDPFPLLLTHNLVPQRAWRVEQGVLTLTTDRRLMLWTQASRGAEQVADDVPAGDLWWLWQDPEYGTLRAVIGALTPGCLSLIKVDLEQLRYQTYPLETEPGVRGFCEHGGALFAVGRDKVQVFNPSTGEALHTLNLPKSMAWQRNRFFRDSLRGNWYALAYDGRGARLEPIFAQADRGADLLTVFECPSVDGPLGITSRGDVRSTTEPRPRAVAHGLTGEVKVRALSPDGARFALESTSAPMPQVRIVSTQTLDVAPHYFLPTWFAIPEIRRFARPHTLRNKFVAIALADRARIVLTTRKHRHLVIDRWGSHVALRGKRDHELAGQRQTFEQLPARAEIGFQLARAAWNDGSAAFLDSRGLLHLQSSDTEIPEVTLVLKDGELAGWCADGRLWGMPYFFGECQSVSSQQVFDTVLTAFAERVAGP